MQTISYQSTDDDFRNPERGFFASNEPNYVTNQTGAALKADALEDWADENNASLVKKNYMLGDYLDGGLSQNFLDMLASDFEAAIEAGVKVIPRFTYNWNLSMGGDDASLERTLGHIEQLSAVFAEYEEAIDHIQGGFIGRWGEMHTSIEGHVLEQDVRLAESGIEIMETLAAAMPDDMTLTVRYPTQVAQLTDGAVGQAEATDGEGGAIIGYVNDGLFHDEGHFGSLDADEDSRNAQLDYLEEVTEFTATSGEPGGDDGSGYAMRTDAIAFLDDLNFTALSREQSDAEQAGVYAHWDQSGELDEISMRLGYRFELQEARLPSEVSAGEAFVMEFDVKNVGFARAHSERPVQIVLRDSEGREFTIETGIDAREWDDGEVSTVRVDAPLPDDFAAGDYEVMLSLPDPSNDLADDPRYSIRLANEGVWEEETGYNTLARVSVTEPAPEPAPVPEEGVSAPAPESEIEGRAFSIIGASMTGETFIADYDLNTGGSETVFDTLLITAGGETYTAADAAGMLDLVRAAGTPGSGFSVSSDGGNLVLSFDNGGRLILEDVAGQLDGDALAAAGVDGGGTITNYEVDGDTSGDRTIIDGFDLDSSGSERTFDILEFNVSGETYRASTDADMLDLVRIAEGAAPSGMAAARNGDDLVFSFNNGGSVVLEDIAGQLGDAALAAVGIGDDMMMG